MSDAGEDLFVLVTDDESGIQSTPYFDEHSANLEAMSWCREQWPEEEGECPATFDEAIELISGGNNYLYFLRIPLTEISGGKKVAELCKIFKDRSDLMKLNEFSNFQTDSSGQPCIFENHYKCEVCDESWENEWSSACNDRCPCCNTETEPNFTNNNIPDDFEALHDSLSEA